MLSYTFIGVFIFVFCRRGAERGSHCQHSVQCSDEQGQEMRDGLQQKEAEHRPKQTGGGKNPGGILRSPVSVCVCVCLVLIHED